MNFPLNRLIATVFLFVSPACAFPQVPGEGDTADQVSPAPPNASESKRASANGKLKRWFELQTATMRTRYQFRESGAGAVEANTLQHQGIFLGRFKFDAAGKYSLSAQLAAGSRFTSGWNNTGLGRGRPATNLFLKHLFVTAAPVKGVELQIGGFDVLRGQATEISTFDNDAYMIGERLTVRRPKELFFDEVAVTYGYLGDFDRPNINKRYHRLKQSNYHQFQVTKKIGDRATLSADYSFFSGAEYLHQALKLRLKESRLIDTLTFENYQRVDVQPAYGFALHAEKTLLKRLTLGEGAALIDRRYPTLNADRFFQGHHWFLTTNYALTPELNAGVFYTHSFATDLSTPIKQRFEVLLNLNLLKSLQRVGLFK